MDKSIIEKAAVHYGDDYQITKAIEKLSELSCELAKRSNDQGLRIHLLDALAGATISLEIIKKIFGDELVSNMVTDKLNKLKDKMYEDELMSGAV